MKKTHWIHKIHLPDWVVGVLALTLILRIPSFFEPYYYGDEMIYLSLGQGVRQGIELYSGIFDNKPPLLYLTAAIAGNLFWFKAILAFWNLGTVVIFYKLSKILFEKSEKIQKIATLVFALLTTLPLLEGNIVNAEAFMIGLTLLAFLNLLGKSLNPKRIFFSGILFGVAALFKIPASFDLPIIVAFWVITLGLSNWKNILRNSFILGLGFLAPILASFVWYFFAGSLGEYIKAAFAQNVGYLSSFRPGDVQKPFLVRNGPLLIRALMVVAGSGILFVFRQKLSKNFILFCLWTLFSLFAVSLSERPYPHYLIQSAAPIAFLLAMLLAQKTVEQAYTVIPLALVLFVPYYYHFYHYKTGEYYLRFIKFASGKMTRDAYFQSFSPNTNRNYELAEFLDKSTLPEQKVFMWDNDSPTVYSLSRRLPPLKYVADYHIVDYSSRDELAMELEKSKPKFIITTSNHPLVEITDLLSTNYLLINQIENAQIWSLVR